MTPTQSQTYSLFKHKEVLCYADDYAHESFCFFGYFIFVFQVSDGHFVHFFAPKNLSPLPKNIVFVIDVSGSMWGVKMKQVCDDNHGNTVIALCTLTHKSHLSVCLFPLPFLPYALTVEVVYTKQHPPVDIR